MSSYSREIKRNVYTKNVKGLEMINEVNEMNRYRIVKSVRIRKFGFR